MLTGTFLILASVKNWHKDFVPRKLYVKLIKETLSPIAYRYFTGSIGLIMIIVPMFLGVQEFIIPKTNKLEERTTDITIKYIDGTYKSPNSELSDSKGASTAYTIISINQIDKIRNNFNLFDSISFENINIDYFPDFLCDMKNMEVINFTNNNLNDLPVSKIQQLPMLRKIILVNNPVDSLKMQKLEKDLNIEIITSIQ